MFDSDHSAPVAANHPESGPWWPSRWGAGDQRGALNLLGHRQVRDAAALITQGAIVDMGFPFRHGRPDFHGRDFTIASAGGPSGGPVGQNRFMYNEDVIAGRFTGMSTHFNALVHVGQQLGKIGDNNTVHYYNGFTHADIGSAWGFRKLGVEHVDPIFTPGLLLDFAGYRGRALNNGEILTREDFVGALARQGLSIGDILPGSALFWRTGNGPLWFSDPEQYNSGCAGIERETAEWLADFDLVLVGADSVALEPIPPINDHLCEVHGTFLCRRGIYMIINVNVEELARREAWRFAFSCTPIPFAGAQGSPARPFAII